MQGLLKFDRRDKIRNNNRGKRMKMKKWSKPECKRVELVPEEAILGGCKLDAPAGPQGRACGIATGGCFLRTS